MKTHITFFLFLLCFFTQPIFAQLEIEGSYEYGRIFDLTYDATVPNKVYAITLVNHIVVSEDNGETWETLYALPIGEGASIKQLKLTPDGSRLTFAAYTPNRPLSAVMVYDIATNEVVKTFSLPNQNVNAFVVSYDFYNDDTNILLVDTNWGVGLPLGKTFYTANGGNSWDEIYFTDNNNTVFVNNVAISPDNPNKLFLARGQGSQGVEGGLFVSENAGQTWEEKLPGIILGSMAFDPSNDQELLIGTDISFGSSEENVYKSTDGGTTFNIVPISWTEGILNSINVIKYNPSNPLQIIILEENEIVISEDAGATWQNFVYLEDDPEIYYYGLNASYNPNNSDQVIISGNYFPFFSNDGGVSLELIQSPFASGTGNMDLYLDGDSANLYYGVQFGYVHRDLNTGIDTAYDFLPLNYVSNSPGITQYTDKFTPNRLYTFTTSFMGATLSVTDDNGTTKNQLASLFKNNFTAVATFPNQNNSILAAFAGFDPSESVLLKYDFSDINNVIETNIDLPILNNISGILIDNSEKVIISIGVDIYSSIDEGANWVSNGNGLEILNPASDIIFDLKRDPFNQERLGIATTKGVFISQDGGENWERKSTNAVFQLAFSTESAGSMIASTFSSQVSEFALHYSIDNGTNWQTITNEQLQYIAGRSAQYVFEDNAVKVYIGSFDLGLISYTIDLSTTNTPDYNENNDIIIYPNPTSDLLNIHSNTNSISEVTLYNMAGQELIKTAESQLNVSSYESGIYLLRVTTNSGNVAFKRIIIK